MKKLLVSIVLILCCYVSNAQESNDYKYVPAKRMINEPIGELGFKQWITEKPKTKGKFMLITFWGTWCGACLREVPRLNELQEKFAKNLVVIGLNDEPLEKASLVCERLNMKYYNALDSTKTLRNALEVKGFPHTLLVDPQGIVRFEGYIEDVLHPLTDEKLVGIIEKYKTVKATKKTYKQSNQNKK